MGHGWRCNKYTDISGVRCPEWLLAMGSMTEVWGQTVMSKACRGGEGSVTARQKGQAQGGAEVL